METISNGDLCGIIFYFNDHGLIAYQWIYFLIIHNNPDIQKTKKKLVLPGNYDVMMRMNKLRFE